MKAVAPFLYTQKVPTSLWPKPVPCFSGTFVSSLKGEWDWCQSAWLVQEIVHKESLKPSIIRSAICLTIQYFPGNRYPYPQRVWQKLSHQQALSYCLPAHWHSFTETFLYISLMDKAINTKKSRHCATFFLHWVWIFFFLFFFFLSELLPRSRITKDNMGIYNLLHMTWVISSRHFIAWQKEFHCWKPMWYFCAADQMIMGQLFKPVF